MFTPSPTEKEVAALGLKMEEVEVTAEVYLDNVHPVNVFIAMLTQWRVGMNGRTGLDYNCMPAVMQWVGVPKHERARAFDGVRVMEEAALKLLERLKR